jgi:ligand-binding sensor domain-containing protein/signal transduction histidine kinase
MTIPCRAAITTIRPGLFAALLVFVLASLAFSLDDREGFARYERQTWQVENGLPQDTVHAILQTRDGFLWLATEGGAVRFDGLKFTSYDSENTPQFHSNDVRAIFEDKSGVLWFGAADGLTRLQNSTWTTFTVADGLPSNNIYSLCGDSAGHLLVVTPEGLGRYEDGHFNTVPLNAGNSLNAIAQANDGTLWLGTQSGLKLLKNGRLAKANLPAFLANTQITSLFMAHDGRLWVGTPEGLCVYDRGRTKMYTTANGLPGNRITTVYEDRRGVIWLSTGGGLARIFNGAVERLPPNDPLSASIILSIFEDREGDLWLGAESQGLTVLRDSKFTTYGVREGLGSDLVRCLYEDRDGTVWLGSNTGLSKFKDGRFSNFTTTNGLSSNLVFALAGDNKGDLLVGTPDGLNVINNGHVRVLTSADGLADDFVRSIYRDDDDSIWIGTRRGLSHWQNNRFTTYTQSDGLASDLVGAILRGHDGTLYIGTLNGLSEFRNGRFTNLAEAGGLASNIVTALHEDRDGTLWVGTQGGGLHRMRHGRIVRFGNRFDLPATIYGILEDDAANLWIASKTGIYRASRHELDAYADGRAATVNTISYGTADGLLINECTGGGHPAAWKTRAGRLWFATLKGAATFDSHRAKLNRLPPPVAIESVTVDGRTIDSSQPLDLAPGSSRLAFEYAGLSFAAPSRVRFKYQLEGFDRDWVDAGAQRIAYYTNIPPGRYNFHVIARNSDGFWNNTGATLSFRLRPRFYQTYWFYLAAVLLLTALGYCIYRLRVNQVQSQFNAVLGERNRIAREIHDTLAQGFVAVSVQLEVVSRLLTISSEAAQEQLERARELVKDSLLEARQSIWQLRSQSSNDDFAARLAKTAERITATAPVKLKLEVNGVYRPLPEGVERELLRIAGEAITNVVRHAQASHVDVHLQFDPKKFRMTIVDDGRGFSGLPNSTGAAGHFGLKGMRERAESIGAKLTIESAPDSGTTVALEAAIS